MKVYIKEGSHEDALRIELHICHMPEDRICMVDNKYATHVAVLVKEGLVELR